MEGKCRQMTLSEALAAEEQQGPGPRVTLLSPSSLLAAKHRLETQYSIFSPHRPRGDNSEPMNSQQCNEFHLPRNGTTAGAAQLLLILPPWRMNEDIPQVSQGTIWAVMNVHCPQPHCWDTGMTLSHPYLVLSLGSQRIRHPRSKPGARGFNCDRVAYSRQLPTGWKRGEGW